MRADASALETTWRSARGRGRRIVARIARRVLPDATVRLTHVVPDVKLRISLRRNLMFWAGGLANYERPCVRLLRAAIEPGDVVMDIGANVGFFATLFSRWAGPRGYVLAVEPDVDNLRLLRSNVEENVCENVQVLPYAVGERPGDAEFSRDRATGATGQLGRGATEGERAVGTGRVEIVSVRVETLDSLAEDCGARVALVKIDIEGGEALALQGASRLLAEHRPIVLSELGGGAGPLAAQRLIDAGYRLWDAESGLPIEDGSAPFLALAMPAETLDSPRSLRVLAALSGTEEASP